MSTQQAAALSEQASLSTEILHVNPTNLGTFEDRSRDLPLEDWDLNLASTSDANRIRSAAHQLQTSSIPVAFPTETVYGLGADATRSTAVKGIYRAKQRPSDNPLIVHFASLRQLRTLLLGPSPPQDAPDPIPAIYHPLLRKFWPGPLTIILPVPAHSALAPEVTAGLTTFGARMPRDLLALSMIKLADRPIAAPSANASTKPSPTAAEHVLHDLRGRITTIIDGGPCGVGVESTVVDGLCSPPAILRPGGVSLGCIRLCEGWEGTVVAYKDVSEKDGRPRAPGMKYRHYSPKAPVVLFEKGAEMPGVGALVGRLGQRRSLGVVRTKTWGRLEGLRLAPMGEGERERERAGGVGNATSEAVANGVRHVQEVLASSSPHGEQLSNGHSGQSPLNQMLREFKQHRKHEAVRFITESEDREKDGIVVWDLDLGADTDDIARGLFSALRDLDQIDVDAIVVEGIADDENDVAAAVMNRLRKAAEVKVN
ncbi:hypothetical protein M8818_004394 [Zalaria obscura]|uniref:Uncharacterized protein n=1 Tax=Zalaria obscura TaxID=2024903 RepID=A0ACC3SE39_9PEZI